MGTWGLGEPSVLPITYLPRSLSPRLPLALFVSFFFVIHINSNFLQFSHTEVKISFWRLRIKMNQAKMKAAWYENTGKPEEVLQIGEIDIPKPKADEVLVRLYASGINPVDIKRRSGNYKGEGYTRIIPHDDGAGVIEAVGEKVSNRIGERVWVYYGRKNRAFGTAAEYITIPSKYAVRLPDNTSFAEGACLGVPAMTAHRCLFQDGSLDGKTVLIQGGSGMVGQYAIQLAKWAGATVIATAGEDKKLEIAREIGADYTVNYKTKM